MKQHLYVITGQTGTGKTKLALELAKKINGVLISADARQVYKHLDVITGKDIENSTFHLEKTYNDYSIGFYSMKGIPVWLYDVVDPKTYFSAYDWAQCAKQVLRIIGSDKTPILIGGSYFYLEALLFGFTEGGEPQWDARKKLEKQSVYELRQQAKEIDATAFKILNNSDQFNPRRLIRFIEKRSLGSSTSMQTTEGIISDYITTFVGLQFESADKARAILEKRVDKRLKNGAVGEVETLLAMRYSTNDPGLNTIGYKQLLRYLLGSTTLADARADWITKEYQYARRQYTLMKRNNLIMWYTGDGMSLPNVRDMV